MQALAAIAAVVASLVGHPTTVTCASAEQWASDPAVIADVSLYGFTPAAYTRLGAGAPEIAVGPFGCQYLSLLFEEPPANDAYTRFFEGEALLLLVHEPNTLQAGQPRPKPSAEPSRSTLLSCDAWA